VDGSGNVIATGLSFHDGYTVKYAALDGALVWEKHGPRRDASSLAVDGSGNAVVTGSSFNGTAEDYYTAKYGSVDGALLWEQRDSGPGTRRAVALDANGNVIVMGSSATAKYAAADGELLWHRDVDGAAIAVDGSGNVVVTGSSFNGNNWDYYTAKFAAADGALLWERQYNGPASSYDFSQAVTLDRSGNVVVAGDSFGNGSGVDIYTAKYATTNGALLWEQRYNGSPYSGDHALAVAVDNTGNVLVTGTSFSDSPDLGLGFGFYTAYAGGYTAKYSAHGALLWQTRYSGTYCDSIGAAVVVDSAGNAIVAGHFYHCLAGGRPDEWYAAKYAAADGALLWEMDHDDRAPVAVAMDAEGNAIMTGYSWDGGKDYYTAKYAAANGALLWEQRYNGPANSSDEARAVTVDAGGNVLVTGYSNNGTNNDYYTAKYAAFDGALIWEKRYNGPANADDEAFGVARDGSGNVLVTGYSSNGTNNDYYTAKYAAANGALIWEKRYTGPGNGDDKAAAVAVDDSGNVVVTGSSHNGSNLDYYTAKYASADGTLLWEKRHNGPANGDDIAQAVSVDGNGNAVVTGYSGNGTNTDYYTAKYAATGGALLWEKRYNGPASGNDTPSSLAIGPNGMVAITGSSSAASSSSEYATVVYRENLCPVSIKRIPAGILIRCIGVPGRIYTIDRAPAATGPWSTLSATAAPIQGIIEYTDTNPPMSSAFYRTSAP
jgi:uncharacterized delta-60 repeat protein